MRRIDINCDMGEGVGNEADLLPYIGSCNIACGAHAGDQNTMRTTVELAIKNQVNIGAHPAYPDKKNFGRVSLEISKKDLQKTLKFQIDTLLTHISDSNAQLDHIKPHGALYNDLIFNTELAQWCFEVFELYNVPLFAPYKSSIAKIAISRGMKVIYEGFADRNYNDDLSLVSRKEPNAVITDIAQIMQHVKSMYYDQRVRTTSGVYKKILAETFCVHSDTENAIQIVKNISTHLNG